LSLAGGGCASVLNLQDETLRKPYGGFTMPIAEFFGGGDFGEISGIFFWPVWLLDKPLSLCADTIMLPYTLWLQRETATPPQTPRSAALNANPTQP
jgi:uncharacterized protein YceK